MSNLSKLEELKRKGLVDDETFDKAKELFIELEEIFETKANDIESKAEYIRLLLA